MKRSLSVALAVVLLAGCGPETTEPPPAQPVVPAANAPPAAVSARPVPRHATPTPAKGCGRREEATRDLVFGRDRPGAVA